MPDRRSALPVVATAAAAYAAFTLLALALHGWNPLWFVWIGERWADLKPRGRIGYDGQFVYYIARDGWAAVPHLDNAPYRFQRILYPMATRLLSGGAPAAMPWAMLAINAVANIVTTLLLARWLAARAVSPWYALAFAFWVGNLMSYSRDLTEPLACALAAGGVLAWLSERRLAAIALLALATLTRETTAVFIGALAIAELLHWQWRRVAVLAAALLPMLAWQVYLQQQFGVAPASSASRMLLLPATANFTRLSLEPGRLSALFFIGLPMLALTPLVARWLVRLPRDPITWLVALHFAFALLLPPFSHSHVLLAGRLISGLVLALVLALPHYSPGVRTAIFAGAVVPTLVWLPVVLWWAPWTAKI